MDKNLITHFQRVQDLIAQGKNKALQAATAYSLATYWNVGAYLSEQLNENTYGKKIVTELADWLQAQDPTLKACDKRSLYRMRTFFDKWNAMDWSMLPQKFRGDPIFIAEMPDSSKQKIVVLTTPQLKGLPSVLTRISWTHHIEILRGAISQEEMMF
jgi:hypothetical protein